MTKQKYLIVVAGPTASGKTALSIELAKHFDAEILSCDSRQFYREMNKGTAKPNAEELAAAVHHFVDCMSIEQEYSVGDFEREAIAFLEDYYTQKDVAIMVGGSGLYIRAVCQGLDNYPIVDKSIREGLALDLETKGLEALQEELKIADPVYYDKVDLQNSHRILRALEICRGSGKPFSSFQGKNKIKRPFKVIKIGIDWDRVELYERINLRVDLMMQAGLLQEAKSLYPQRHLNALQTVGYREFFDFFDGTTTLEEAVVLLKRNTRRYAKRQMTWFRKEEGLIWVKAGLGINETISLIEKELF